MSVRRGWAYFFFTSVSSLVMILRMRLGSFTVAWRSAISPSSASTSWVRLRIYSLLMLRRRMSATYSAWIWSMPNPIIRLGTTSASSSVSRMMAMARSISSRMRRRPFSRCSLSSFFFISWYTLRRTQSIRQAVHSSRISRTPITRGMPAMRILKLQDWESMSGVARNSLAISLSGSVPRLRSMVSFRPERSVSSRMSAISLILPALMSSATLSIMASEVVE